MLRLFMTQAVRRRTPTVKSIGRYRGQSMRDLWWTTWHWERFSSKYFYLFLSVWSHHRPTLIFFYMLLLPHGSACKDKECYKNPLLLPILVVQWIYKSCFILIFPPLTFWRRTFFQILAHSVFKMWVMQKPNKVALWNKRHFEGEKMEII